jgi:RES domain-containing protein
VTESVTIWRLYPLRLAKEALSGDRASLYGGRWNLRGTRVVYFSESRALAAMEALVNVEDTKDLAAEAWQAIALILPVAWVERPLHWPPSWDAYPKIVATQSFGSDWARSRSTVALRVPSAVISGEFNYLLNPEHPDFDRLELTPAMPFRFDARLLR